MSTVDYKILERREKLHVRTYLMLCLILLLSVGFYSYKKWQEYSLAKLGLTQNQSYIELLRNEAAGEKTTYESDQKDFQKVNKVMVENLKVIFPDSDNYTNLTRQIDKFEAELSKKNEPFEIANIDYQAVIETETYSVLPLRMNIRSSDGNFTKFLHLVENSGALDEEIRLMDISSIRLNFDTGSAEKTGPEIINFSVQINAYFQK